MQSLKKLEQEVPNLDTQLRTVFQWLKRQNSNLFNYSCHTVQIEVVRLEKQDLVYNQLIYRFVFMPDNIFITVQVQRDVRVSAQDQFSLAKFLQSFVQQKDSSVFFFLIFKDFIQLFPVHYERTIYLKNICQITCKITQTTILNHQNPMLNPIPHNPIPTIPLQYSPHLLADRSHSKHQIIRIQVTVHSKLQVLCQPLHVFCLNV